VVKSAYLVFPKPMQISVCEEEVAPPEPGEVLCLATRSLISTGTETHCLRGIFDPGTNWASWVQYPFRPGYSMAARVVALGKDVTGFKEGDRVAASVSHQQYFRVPAHRAYLLPEGITDEDATWFNLACTTQLAIRRAELRLGETVGIVGLGILGQFITQYAWLSGARRVIGIDRLPVRLAAAREHGATHILDMDAQDARTKVASILGGRLLDVAFDVTGHPAALAPTIQLVRRLGRVVLAGDTPTPTQQFLGPGVVSNSVAILGIHGSTYPAVASEFAPWSHREMAMLFFDYLVQGRMRMADLVTHRHSPLDAPAVYDGLLRDRSAVIGAIFDWTGL
jgi:2-desacetyl-2-hydroxyethyl bacteriochlorophyllide A dehydrogenase